MMDFIKVLQEGPKDQKINNQQRDKIHKMLVEEKFNVVKQIAKIIIQNPNNFNQTTLELCIKWCLNLNDLNNEKSKTLVSVLKAISVLPFKLDQIPESFIKMTYRLCFLGIPQFAQTIQATDFSDFSSDSDSSSSETTYGLGKIRSVSVVLLRVLIKEYPQYSQQNWSIFIRIKNYHEQSLLSLLVHEQRRTLRINILSTIITLLDVLNVGKWIQGHDFHKQQKSFQPKAYQYFQAIKSIHETTLYILQDWKKLDYQLNTALLKLILYLIQYCYLLTKLPEEETVYPLYQLYLQIQPLSEGFNMKVVIYQIIGMMLQQGSKLLDVKYIVKNALKNIQEYLHSQDHILYVQECFTIIQKVQQHYHTQCMTTHSNMWDILYGLKQQCNEPRLLQQYFRIYEEMAQYIQTYPVYYQILLETLSSTIEIVPCGLNILSYLDDTFWNTQEEKAILETTNLIQQLHSKIFSETPFNTSSLKISFYKGIGSFCNCQSVTDIVKARQILVTLFTNLPGHNIHVLEKSSWAAANLSSLIPLDDSFYQLFIYFSTHAKEKISTNGLRGLGYFLMRTKSEYQDLANLYQKSLLNSNPKIIWNACTSLNNAIKNPYYLYIIKQNQQPLLEILLNKDNLKAQMHCIELVTKYSDDIQWASNILNAMLHILNHFSDHDNFLEQKYQPKMRQLIFDSMIFFFKKYQINELQLQFNSQVQERVTQEIYRHLISQKPENSEIIIAKQGLTKEDILKQISQKVDDESTFKAQNEYDYPIERYLIVQNADEGFRQSIDQFRQLAECILQINQVAESLALAALDIQYNEQVPQIQKICFLIERINQSDGPKIVQKSLGHTKCPTGQDWDLLYFIRKRFTWLFEAQEEDEYNSYYQ